VVDYLGEVKSSIGNFFNNITMPSGQPIAFLPQSRLYVALDSEEDEEKFVIDNIGDERYLRVSGGLKPYRAWIKTQYTFDKEDVIELTVEEDAGKVKLESLQRGTAFVYIGDSLGRARGKWSTSALSTKRLMYIIDPVIVDYEGEPIPGKSLTLEVGEAKVVAFYAGASGSSISWSDDPGSQEFFSFTSPPANRFKCAIRGLKPGTAKLKVEGDLDTEDELTVKIIEATEA